MNRREMNKQREKLNEHWKNYVQGEAWTFVKLNGEILLS